MSIGDRIKARRLELGLTLEEVGEKLGLNRSTVMRYENGRIKKMSEETIESFALVLKTTTGELLGWDKSQNLSKKVLVLARQMQELPPEKLELLSSIVESMSKIADEEAKK
jgi:repressor LexA